MLQTAASGVNSLGQDPKEKADKPEADPLSAAKAIALRQLSMAAKTRYQLEQSLTKKGFTPEIIRVSLDRLTEVGLIDDLAYAGMLVRSRCVTKKVSRSVLRMELRQKGISDEHIDSALTQISDKDEYRMASELVTKKLRSMRGLEPDVMKRRLFGLLARKGYHAGIVTRVIREQLKDRESLADSTLQDFA
jgi:regulatory protein